MVPWVFQFLLGYNIVAIVTLVQQRCEHPIGLDATHLATHRVHLLIAQQLPRSQSGTVDYHIVGRVSYKGIKIDDLALNYLTAITYETLH